MNIALIIAGGTGARVGNEIPKQFLTVNEVPVIIYTLKVFQEQKSIDKIAVVCLSGWQEVLKAYCRQFGISKLEAVFDAGDTRFDSINNGLNGISALVDDDDLVSIHDANRPLVSPEIIIQNQEVASKYGCALTAIPCNDTMFFSYDRIVVNENVDRSILFAGQSPETFKYRIIKDIYERAQVDNTGDLSSSALMVKYGYKVCLSKGSSINFKITTIEDLYIFRALISCRENITG